MMKVRPLVVCIILIAVIWIASMVENTETHKTTIAKAESGICAVDIGTNRYEFIDDSFSVGDNVKVTINNKGTLSYTADDVIVRVVKI